jgi:mannose-6-phosphate isomerase-like protein (cupin superfamily)
VSVRVSHVTEVPTVPSPVEGLVWRPVRHHLDVRSFGTNAYTGASPGDLVVEPHDEDEFEELYVVLTGAARFTVDDETFEAPAGTLVLVTPPSQRVAHATEADTTILAVGAVPGKAFEVSGWEDRWLAEGLRDRKS